MNIGDESLPRQSTIDMTIFILPYFGTFPSRWIEVIHVVFAGIGDTCCSSPGGLTTSSLLDSKEKAAKVHHHYFVCVLTCADIVHIICRKWWLHGNVQNKDLVGSHELMCMYSPIKTSWHSLYDSKS